MTEAVERKAKVTTPGDRDIVIEREWDAPREVVFKAMLDPELIPEWWGPFGVTTEVDQMDVQVGGKWRFVCHNADGSQDCFNGTYLEIEAPAKLVQTFEWEGLPGHISHESSVFEDLGERTRMTTTASFHTPEDRDGMIAAGMEGGMNETQARFDELLAKLQAG